jgi:hypothetical protein
LTSDRSKFESQLSSIFDVEMLHSMSVSIVKVEYSEVAHAISLHLRNLIFLFL